MKMMVAFDIDADIIDVPDEIAEKRNSYRNKLLDWLYNKKVKHSYRKIFYDSHGNKSEVMCYRSDAFVEWLNKKPLRDSAYKATIVETHVEIDENFQPQIFF